jgi:phosphatidylinositol alpha-1,6-mannosyltransferase
MLAKPVVATDVGDIATVLRERGAGVVTAPEAETFAAGIGSLLEDPERAATLGANGRRLAETDLDWRRLAEALEQLYRTAVGSTALPNRYRMRAVEQA